MIPFTNDDLKVFIQALFKRYSLGNLKIKEGSIKLHEQCIAFQGKGERMRKEHYYAIPYASTTWGVISPKSILHAASAANLSWMINGQALGKTETLIHIGSHSDQATSLHANKKMLKAWTHEKLPNAPAERYDDFKAHFDKNYEAYIAKGIFLDEVSIGHYVPSEETDYMKLKLQPISSDSFSFDVEEATALNMGR